MKTTEAPEKIYIQPDAQDGWFMVNNLNNTLVEYTRTDALIEKAMKFLYDYNKNMVKKHGARAVLGCSEFTINVVDFKNYIKGE